MMLNQQAVCFYERFHFSFLHAVFQLSVLLLAFYHNRTNHLWKPHQFILALVCTLMCVLLLQSTNPLLLPNYKCADGSQFCFANETKKKYPGSIFCLSTAVALSCIQLPLTEHFHFDICRHMHFGLPVKCLMCNFSSSKSAASFAQMSFEAVCNMS